jgi:hypothetical protein
MVLNRSVISMKSLTRGWGLALLGAGMLGLISCGEDNEAAIRAQESKTSSAEVKDTTPPPKDQRDYFKQQPNPYTKAERYPGAGRKK